MKLRMSPATVFSGLSLAYFIAIPWAIAAMPAAWADDAPPRDGTPSEFQPGDISIGDPIPLRSASPRSDAPPALPLPVVENGEPRSLLAVTPKEPTNASAPSRGTGWLGLVVAESAAPGRWTVDEVAVGGPAAGAGVATGDEVRAIDGIPLRSADDVSQALTAIAPGQRVGLSIARGEHVTDLVLMAVDRPVALNARTWQASPDHGTAATTPPEAPAFATAPPPFTSPEPAATPASPPSSRFAAPRVAANVPQAPAFQATPPAPAELPAPTRATVAVGRTALGVRTVPIDSGLQLRFQLPEAAGAYVIGVVQDLPAAKAGVPPGSVIVALDNRPVRSPDELTRLVTAGPIGRPVAIQYILPGGEAHRADVTLQSLERPLEEALVGPSSPSATLPPQLELGPSTSTARRPESDHGVATVTVLEAEVRDLKARLETLERRLDAAPR